MIGLDGTNPMALRAAVGLLLAEHGQSLPPVTLAAVLTAQGPQSPYDVFVPVAEALFAARGVLADGPLQLGLALSRFIATVFGPIAGPDHVGDPTRAPRMVAAFRRQLGEIDADIAPPAFDPEPWPNYSPA